MYPKHCFSQRKGGRDLLTTRNRMVLAYSSAPRPEPDPQVSPQWSQSQARKGHWGSGQALESAQFPAGDLGNTDHILAHRTCFLAKCRFHGFPLVRSSDVLHVIAVPMDQPIRRFNLAQIWFSYRAAQSFSCSIVPAATRAQVSKRTPSVRRTFWRLTRC